MSENHGNPDYIFKLKRAIYGLKQAAKAWYERLSGLIFIKKDLIMVK